MIETTEMTEITGEEGKIELQDPPVSSRTHKRTGILKSSKYTLATKVDKRTRLQPRKSNFVEESAIFLNEKRKEAISYIGGKIFILIEESSIRYFNCE